VKRDIEIIGVNRDNEVKREIEIIGVNRDNEVKQETEIIGLNRDNEVKQETEIIGLNRDNKVKQETEIIGDNVSKIMLTTAADVTIRPFEMLPCYVVNDQDIDKKDKLTIHSIFDENNLVEKPCAEEIIEESETKDIVFEKSKDCPIGVEVLSLPIELGDEKRQILYMINTSNKHAKFKSGDEIGAISTIKLNDLTESHVRDENYLTDTLEDISFDEIPDKMRDKMRILLTEYKNIFAKTSYDIESTDLIEHSIETEGSSPIRHRPYRTPFKLQEELKRHLDEMIKHGIIRESSSPWAAPILLVKKPNTTETRIVVDYRSLNKITKHDSFPCPLISSIFDNLGNKKVFSTIDLASGFFQIPMEKKSIEKTAFICEQGLFEYLRTPMGLRNSPSTMNRLLLRIFKNKIGKSIQIFMDDILIMSNSYDEHIVHLRETFEILKRANLRAKAKKCSFMSKRVPFLGHIITPEGRIPNPATVEKVIKYKKPTTLKDLQGFIGLCSYYRTFVKNFSDIAHPLIELTKKSENKNVDWTEEAQKSFESLKSLLTTEPILAHPLFDLEFILQTDASGHSLGAVLSQVQNGKEVAISYASRHLNAAEKKYPSIEREALAIIFGIRQFKHYLLDNPFTIETDCRPLLWLEKIKDTDSGRLQRWGITLSSMKYKIKYKEGKIHRNADFFSRLPIATIQEMSEEICLIKQEQETDPLCRQIAYYLEKGELLDRSIDFPGWLPYIDFFQIKRGILWHVFLPTSKKRDDRKVLQVVLPSSLRKTILEEYHDKANHFAFLKTYLNVQKRYYWPDMLKEIKEYCKACVTCAKTKKLHTAVRPLLRPIDIARGPWDVVSLDFMGPIRPKSRQGNSYIMVSTCLFSKYVDCIALPEISARTTAKALIERIFYQHGAPRCILSDRGSQFTSKLFKHLLEILGIDQKLTTAWHPQCNGQTERANKTLCQIIRGYINDQHDNWEDLLEPIRFAFVNSVSSSTQFSPYFLTHLRDPVMLIDQIMNAVNDKVITPQDYVSQALQNLNKAYNMVRANLVKERQHQKEQYDKRAKDLKYQAGDKVLLDVRGVVPPDKCKKFLPKYEGPYRILKVYENGTAEITAEGVTKHVNLKRIIPLYETMIWHDEACPNMSPVPRGTDQFTKQDKDLEILIEEPQVETRSDPESDSETESDEEGRKDEPTNSERKDSDEKLVQGDSRNTKNVLEGRYNLRNRRLLKQPGWLKNCEQIKD